MAPGMLDTNLMLGVGAAFGFHTGRIKDCRNWIKCAGLQWLHRLIQDPKHLFWRYLRNNPAFLWHITLQLAGIRKYEDYVLPDALSRDEGMTGEGAPELCGSRWS